MQPLFLTGEQTDSQTVRENLCSLRFCTWGERAVRTLPPPSGRKPLVGVSTHSSCRIWSLPDPPNPAAVTRASSGLAKQDVLSKTTGNDVVRSIQIYVFCRWFLGWLVTLHLLLRQGVETQRSLRHVGWKWQTGLCWWAKVTQELRRFWAAVILLSPWAPCGKVWPPFWSGELFQT